MPRPRLERPTSLEIPDPRDIHGLDPDYRDASFFEENTTDNTLIRTASIRLLSDNIIVVSASLVFVGILFQIAFHPIVDIPDSGLIRITLEF